jgi:hypothetical protein
MAKDSSGSIRARRHLEDRSFAVGGCAWPQVCLLSRTWLTRMVATTAQPDVGLMALTERRPDDIDRAATAALLSHRRRRLTSVDNYRTYELQALAGRAQCYHRAQLLRAVDTNGRAKPKPVHWTQPALLAPEKTNRPT